MTVENNGHDTTGGFSFVAGLLFGTLVGAATAVLLAPASGRDLRDSLGKGAKKLVVKASEMVPEEWAQIAEDEIAKQLLDNVANLRSAGL